MPARVTVRRRGTGFRPEGGFEHRFRAMTATPAARPTERARQARTGLASGCSMLRRCTRSISCASSKPNSKLLIRHRISSREVGRTRTLVRQKKWRRPHAMERRAGCRAERGITPPPGSGRWPSARACARQGPDPRLPVPGIPAPSGSRSRRARPPPLCAGC